MKAYNSQMNTFNKITDELAKLYEEKNRRYGNSFSKQVDEYGMLVAVIRLSDKMERLKSLVKNPKDCGDETMRDTLVDLANYAIMSVMELDKKLSSSNIIHTINENGVPVVISIKEEGVATDGKTVSQSKPIASY